VRIVDRDVLLSVGRQRRQSGVGELMAVRKMRRLIRVRSRRLALSARGEGQFLLDGGLEAELDDSWKGAFELSSLTIVHHQQPRHP
jgi:hypothetical protein